MTYINKLILSLTVLIFLLSSCDKEPISTSGIDLINPTQDETITVTSNPLVSRSSGATEAGLDFDCFSINYPFQVVDEQGNIYDVSAATNWETLVLQDSNSIVGFVFPLNVSLEDGTIVTIEDDEQIFELFANCVPAGGWSEDFFPAYSINFENSCFEIVYPIGLINLNGELNTANNESEFEGFLAEEAVSFNFPFTLQDEGGTSFIVNNIDELFETLFSCNGFEGDSTDWSWEWDWESDFEYIACHTLHFPFSVQLINGEIVEVLDHVEYNDLLIQGEVLGYAFPMTLTDEEGFELIVNSEAELTTLWEECLGPEINFDSNIFTLFIASYQMEDSLSCLSIEFPIQFLDFENNNITIFNLEEYRALIEADVINFCCLVYPITVTIIETQEIIATESSEQLAEVILNNCF